MTETTDLIDRLAATATPVRRMPGPWVRASAWLLLAVVVISVLALQHGPRADLAARLQDPWFVGGLLASGFTGVLAGIAAFLASLPDRTRLWLWMPVPVAVAWLATVGTGCFTHWVSIGIDGIRPGPAASCFATLLLAAVPLSGALFWMLRHVALLRPAPILLTGALAVAALTATALSLLHGFEASAMILVWNFGTAALVLAANMLASRKIFGLGGNLSAPPAE
jgi:hypothetical protein